MGGAHALRRLIVTDDEKGRRVDIGTVWRVDCPRFPGLCGFEHESTRCYRLAVSVEWAGMRTLIGALLLAQTAAACSTGREEPRAAAAGGHAGNAAAGSGSGLAGNTAGGGSSAALDPGRKELHRLNTVEYNLTLADVLATTLQPANGNWRGGELSGFDNIASVLGIDQGQYERYFNAAGALAAEVMASDAIRSRFVTCEIDEPACVRASIEALGLRLFRRPLAPDEVTTYQRVHDTARALGDSPSSALELSFQALLSSAEFLYRIELDPEPSSTAVRALNGFELASRLSYFLWSSAPDDDLLALAADGSLADPSVLAASADRMLDDPKSERLVAHFAGQWLGARDVLSHAVGDKPFEWSPQVALAAGDEMLRFFSEFLRTERSWFEFPVADINFVEPWLAALYGMPRPTGSPERVEYTGDRRAGFFGLAGFLALTSFDRRTSPSLRGSWIAGNMLCKPPEDPPADVPKLEPDGVDSSALSVREILEQHSQIPSCAGCHALFDPYGLALEEYDEIGKPRSAYADGTPVDASAVLPPSDAHPVGLEVIGLQGLADAIAADPQFGRCLIEKMLTYGLGRTVTPADRPYLEQVGAVWSAPGEVPSLRRLIRTLVLSEPFRFRRGEGAARSEP
jgi:hypothetical protein